MAQQTDELRDAQLAFVDALVADGPNPEYAEELKLFGQFVGRWDLEWTGYAPDGTTIRATGEWTFGWVLDGRAVQDVWIVPSRAERAAGDNRPGEYGSTLRFYDAGAGVWRAVWIGPGLGNIRAFSVTGSEDEIVLSGHDPEGNPLRWIFHDIRPKSFRWRDEISKDQGAAWSLQEEMFVHRGA